MQRGDFIIGGRLKRRRGRSKRRRRGVWKTGRVGWKAKARARVVEPIVRHLYSNRASISPQTQSAPKTASAFTSSNHHLPHHQRPPSRSSRHNHAPSLVLKSFAHSRVHPPLAKPRCRPSQTPVPQGREVDEHTSAVTQVSAHSSNIARVYLRPWLEEATSSRFSRITETIPRHTRRGSSPRSSYTSLASQPCRVLNLKTPLYSNNSLQETFAQLLAVEYVAVPTTRGVGRSREARVSPRLRPSRRFTPTILS